MTDQPRAACYIFAAYCQPGRRRCDDCDTVNQPAPREKRAAPKPLDLPEDLSGYDISDFLP